MMKNFKFLLSLLMIISLLFVYRVFCLSNVSAITYIPGFGRFGDGLLNYSKAKWLSYKYNIPIFCTKFPYYDSLKICEIEKAYKNGMENDFKEVVRFKEREEPKFPKEDGFKINRSRSCLYISNYYVDVKIDWEDEEFISELKKTIAPIIEINKQELPKDRVSVAVHVRKGGGFDDPIYSDPDAKNNGQKCFVDKVFPEKFPPDSFYIEQIKKLYEILGNVPMYVYIFTDDHDPARIINKYEKFFVGLDIKLDCRKSGNCHNNNVVEDFFTMMQFDCLIRSGSNFSFFVDMIGDFSAVISLEKAHWEGCNWIADKVDVKINN